MNTHVCIKPACGATYQSEDEERYYCPPCLEAKMALAAQIDAQIANRPPKLPRSSALQEYDQAPKAHGFMIVKL